MTGIVARLIDAYGDWRAVPVGRSTPASAAGIQGSERGAAMGSYLNDVRKIAREAGLKLETTKGGHQRLTKPGEPGTVIYGTTPRKPHRAIRNLEADIRRTWGRD